MLRAVAGGSGGGGGTGTVTTVSVVSANGLAGTVANPTTTPAITLSTTITGLLQGNGTSISAATTTGTGSVVQATSPTLVTPVIGDATGTSLTLSGQSLTGTTVANVLNMAATWNVGTTVETAIKLNITDTASNAASLLMDLQLGGVSKWSFDKTGSFLTTGNTLQILPTGADGMTISSVTGSRVGSTKYFGWTNGSSLLGTPDLLLYRDAGGVLAQRNSTSAQTLRVYNTFTDASNYERGVMDWTTTANTLTIGPQAAGTGSLRVVSAVAAWTFSVAPKTPSAVVGSLPSAATAGATARSYVTDALTPVFGNTVTGGGAVAVPVYSDGTAWRVG